MAYTLKRQCYQNNQLSPSEETKNFIDDQTETKITNRESMAGNEQNLQQTESSTVDSCALDAVFAKELQIQLMKEYLDNVKALGQNHETKIQSSFGQYHISQHLVKDPDGDSYSNYDESSLEEDINKECNLLPKRNYIVRGHIVKELPKTELHFSQKFGLNVPTKLVLQNLINKGVLEDVTTVISTGKESIVLQANGNTKYSASVPKKCAIKAYNLSYDDLEKGYIYLKNDHRYRDKLTRKTLKNIVYLWAEHEKNNLECLKRIGVNCPEVVFIKKHVLVTSLIGKGNKPAKTLRDTYLVPEKWAAIYEEVVDAMCKMFQEGDLVHSDLTASNVLWWDNKCWFIDVSQSLRKNEPRALNYLYNDCCNISSFFASKQVPEVQTGAALYKSITNRDPKYDIYLR